ncbi:KSR2 Kinase, partial [Donacobius atricapilla]|nr:KSR2 Kinase [Donacobius atricapilla]
SVLSPGGSLSKQDWTIQWPSTEPGKENSPGCAPEPGPWGRTQPSPKVQPKCGQHHCHAGSPHGPVYTHVDRLTVEGPPGLCPPLEPGHRSLPPSPRQRHAAHTPPRTPNIVTTMTPPGTPPVRRRNKLKPPGTPPPSSRKLIHLIPGFTALHRSKSHEFQLGHRVDEAHTPNPKSSFSAGKHQAGPKGMTGMLKVTWGSSQCPLCPSPCWLCGGTPLPNAAPAPASSRRGLPKGNLLSWEVLSSLDLPSRSPPQLCWQLPAATSGHSWQRGSGGFPTPAAESEGTAFAQHCSLYPVAPSWAARGKSWPRFSFSDPRYPSRFSCLLALGGPFPPIPKSLALTGESQGMVRNVLGCFGCSFRIPLLPAGPWGSAPRSSAGTSRTLLPPRPEPQGGGPTSALVGFSPCNSIVPDALCPPQNEEGAEEVQESEDDFEEMNLSLLSARNFPRKASQTSIFLQEWDIPFEQLEIGELIGKGRFGQVFHGRWHGEVAIRLIDIERDNEDQLKAFKREVMAYRQTRHENVVLFMGACMSPPHLAIITSLCKGRTLYSVVRDAKIVLDVNKTRQIAQEIVKGMGYLHAKGILHKDLKSKNVFYDNGKVVITDFGLFSISGVLQAGRRENKLRIQNGWLCHLAPEIIRQLSPDTEEDKLPFSKHSDVFALGTIWYELHAREWPFKTQPAEAIIWQVGRGMKPNLSQIGMGKEISDILLFCWAYEQEERPTFTKLMDMLEKLPKRNRRLSHPGHFWKSAE